MHDSGFGRIMQSMHIMHFMQIIQIMQIMQTYKTMQIMQNMHVCRQAEGAGWPEPRTGQKEKRVSCL